MTRPSDPLTILRQTFGYDRFRPPQQEVMDTVMGGRDALVLMPTGGGKSLCYQLPALASEGMAIVVSPLIALMADQVSALRQLGIRAACLNSSLDAAEQRAVTEQLIRGELDLLYVAPERLLKPATLALLQGIRVCLIAIDEAHCVSQWGHDFRQDYLQLDQLAEALPGVPRLALTATADARTRNEIIERLALDDARVFISGFDRPNIRYAVMPKTQPQAQLLQFLKAHEGASGIVYCLSRKKVERTAEALSQRGYLALPYHAGLDNDTRHRNQQRFLMEDSVIMVATIAFGMGIDKPDVRFVAHMDLPKSMEAYYQETGRAGRDGDPAEAWMIYGLQDVVWLRQMSEQSQAPEQQKRIERQKLDTLLGWCEVTECRRQSLLAYFGETLAEPCGNCDVCLAPPETWDATEDAQKLLSAVYRSGQRFGAMHVVDILRGQETDKVLGNGHQQLSVFGQGAHLDATRWRSVIRQLVVRGLLRVDAERYNALVLTPECRPLLRGETSLHLRLDRKPAKMKRPPRQSAEATTLDAGQQAQFESLRELRQRLAQEAGVPPYVIFHDRTLVDMVLQQPRDEAALLMVPGVGEKKLQRYGSAFLQALQESGSSDEHHAAQKSAATGS